MSVLFVTVALLEDKVARLEQENAQLRGRLDSSEVAFSASLSSSVNLDPWETLVFGTVLTNKGDSYSNVYGTFSAPRRGMYVFFVHVLGSQKSNEFCMQKNNDCILLLYTPGAKYHGNDANSIVLELNRGDVIKVVKKGPYGEPPFYVHNKWSTFSGFMLYSIN